MRATLTLMSLLLDIVRSRTLTITIDSMPPLPAQDDAEGAVIYTKALLKLFEQRSATNPHLHPDLIEQAIADALKIQCMILSASALGFVISPTEVTLAQQIDLRRSVLSGMSAVSDV
jgi:hypothetical protein